MLVRGQGSLALKPDKSDLQVLGDTLASAVADAKQAGTIQPSAPNGPNRQRRRANLIAFL